MRIFWLILVLIIIPGPAGAFNPAVLFDTPNPDDGSYKGSAFSGILAFEKYRHLEVEVITPGRVDLRHDFGITEMVRVTAEKGFDPIIGVGFSFGPVIRALAPQYPGTSFIVIDDEVSGPNVQSIVFREQEGSFLMGYLAGMATKSMKVGFVGGMDCQLIRKFGCAFAQGVAHLNPAIQVFQVMTGDTIQAFSDPEKGAELTRELVDRGVDVVFHAAGMTGTGVIRAAVESNILAIGVDSNQNVMAPRNMLTSMMKRMDVAIFTALSRVMDGEWKPGKLELGLKERGIDWALDEHNITLITENMQDCLDDLTFGIIAGQIRVHTYSEAAGCPFLGFTQPSARISGD